MNFLKNTQLLEEKLRVILIQLPPSFTKNSERLEEFLIFYCNYIKSLKFQPVSTVEFRNKTWHSDQIYNILKKYNIGLAISNGPEIEDLNFTANFIYIRMHGKIMYKSSYSEKELKKLETYINALPTSIQQVFVYFNNTYDVHAIDNAKYLISLFEK